MISRSTPSTPPTPHTTHTTTHPLSIPLKKMLRLTTWILLLLPTTSIYVHHGAVTTQSVSCQRMYIGKTNSTERIRTSSYGTYSGSSCDPRQGAGRMEVPTNVGHFHRLTPFWCPSKANPYEFFQISLKEGPTKIGGFLMQGTVTTFEVEYALNDINTQYYSYRERDHVRLFQNTLDRQIIIQSSGTSTTTLTLPIYKHTMTMRGSAMIQVNQDNAGYPLAQHIRFYPKEWTSGQDLIMKVELLECIACGDGFRDRTEECDDGNMIDGDGCSGSNAVILGYKKPCSMETHLGLFWCEPRTDGPRRGNAVGDCLYRADPATGTSIGGEHVTKAPQSRYYAERHYSDRGGISTGGYNNGILPLCDGVVCDGQNPNG